MHMWHIHFSFSYVWTMSQIHDIETLCNTFVCLKDVFVNRSLFWLMHNECHHLFINLIFKKKSICPIFHYTVGSMQKNRYRYKTHAEGKWSNQSKDVFLNNHDITNEIFSVYDAFLLLYTCNISVLTVKSPYNSFFYL